MLNWNFIINLDRRPDRWDEIIQKINNSCLKDEKFIRYSAFDGNKWEEELKRLDLENDGIIKYLKNKKMNTVKGVFGCYMSHYTLLKSILNNKEIRDDEWVGIFEDDFFPYNDSKIFTKLWKKIKMSKEDLDKMEIDMLYIGGKFNSGFMVPIHDFYLNFDITSNPNLFKRKNIYELVSHGKLNTENIDRTTSSYIVKKSSIPTILKALSINFVSKDKNGNTNFIPIDYTYVLSSKIIKSGDYFPHLFYSPLEYSTDIQGIENQKNKIYFTI